jgi:hypothetical protein
MEKEKKHKGTVNNYKNRQKHCTNRNKENITYTVKVDIMERGLKHSKIQIVREKKERKRGGGRERERERERETWTDRINLQT